MGHPLVLLAGVQWAAAGPLMVKYAGVGTVEGSDCQGLAQHFGEYLPRLTKILVFARLLFCTGVILIEHMWARMRPVSGPTDDMDDLLLPPQETSVRIATECCICTEAWGSEKVCRTACNHHFHTQCAERWLKTSRLCPLCREDLVALNHREGTV
mmetsp:Transcript_26989/g.57458  ORF Transcript_26989/g.57458 Transcript_26989/m.57458 type:complete len:155 (+) Transcript_26989:2-466(+)